jgi:DNA polymerase III delta prime subunit
MSAVTTSTDVLTRATAVNGFNVANIVTSRLMTPAAAQPSIVPAPVGLSQYAAMNFSKLEQDYEGLERFLVNVAAGSLRGLIVTGPPGVGKTTSVTRFLDQHATAPYKVVAGHMSVITLYCELYRHKDPGQVIVLDDVDSAFKSMEGINVVKAASDSVPQRRISWATSSSVLKAWSIPQTFSYDGGIILISNETQRKGRQSKLGQHIAAIADRLHTVSLGSNDKDEQLHQLCYQVVHGGLLDSRGLTPAQQCDVLDYISENFDEIERVSLRTATKIAELMRLEPQHWRSMANIGVLNSIDHAGGN